MPPRPPGPRLVGPHVAGPQPWPSAPAIGRLTRRPDYLAAAKGRRFHTDRLSIQAMRRESPGLRVGLTITRKVGHATERNRIRRRLRAAVAEALAPFAPEALDIVVIGRRPALLCEFPVLRDDLLRGFAAVTGPGQRRSAGSRPSGSPRTGPPSTRPAPT